MPTYADDTLEFSHDITTAGLTQDINVALVIDVSGSTANSSGSDVDGDGDIDTFLEAQQIAAKALFQQFIDAGYDPDEIEFTVVTYASGSTVVGTYTLNDQAAFETAIDGLVASGATNFESPLQSVISEWESTTTDGTADNNPESEVTDQDTNLVVFLSDGYVNSGGTYDDEASTLQTQFNAQISAIGVGANSSIDDLNIMDNTGGAEKVTDAAGLIDAINTPPPMPDLDYVEVVLTYPDGSTQVVTYPAGAPPITSTALGYSIDCQSIPLAYLPPAGSNITVEVKTYFEDGTLILSTGSIEVSYQPCFVMGTLILTLRGEVPVEDLRQGDMVVTMDKGPMPIRWIGASRVHARGIFAPIRIKAGTLENKRDLLVSPQHRMMLRGWRAELMFGESEVLVSAKSLVNDSTIRSAPADTVVYYHILFDSHQIVYAEGAPSESFFPGDIALDGMASQTRAEIFRLFPALATDRRSYGSLVRASLRDYEARALKEVLLH
ncbi:Hint domain-containing protein [Rhodovulum imhoffii]|uniref:Hint domain-containing protein n=1 Tax=Rhodovulum imhoffii TaxID=365340 RepID=UPI0014732294|nr:Hint domain-containing protein [Rhodovulum imhoffii]